MAIRRGTPNLKTRPDLQTEIHPHVFEAGDVFRPKGSNRGDKDGGSSHQFAPFIPVEWQDNLSKDWFCLSSGKMVGLTADGWVVPAGLRVIIDNGTAATDLFVYTPDDVEDGVMDITTGEAVEGAVTYTVGEVETALKKRGLIDTAESITDYFSPPVGAVLQAVYSPFSLGDATDPINLKHHNYLKQKGIQYTTDTLMHIPVVPFEDAASATLPSSLTSSIPTVFGGTLATYGPSYVVQCTRYSAITATNFVAVFLADTNIAANTDRSPITCSNATVLVREIKHSFAAGVTLQDQIAAAVARLSRAGDFYVDAPAGVIFMYEDGGNAAVGGGDTLTYSVYYAAATTGDNLSKYMCVEGLVRPGDFLKVTKFSNLTKWESGDAEALKVGRCHGLVREPNGLVESVRTHSGHPGSATGGYSANVVATNAANLVAKVKLFVR